MASCDINTLLASGKCFAALPQPIQPPAALSLWCDISGGSTPGVADQRVTSTGDTRTTSGGDTRIVEP